MPSPAEVQTLPSTSTRSPSDTPGSMTAKTRGAARARRSMTSNATMWWLPPGTRAIDVSDTYRIVSSGENARPLGWRMASVATVSSPVSRSSRKTKQPPSSESAR